MDGTRRSNITTGTNVAIVTKANQKSGELTSGEVESILTKSETHPHGIKVKLKSGEIGRVKIIAPH
ncbi:MAG: YwbE family protein [Spirochaetales bacterium]|nr:YwbE family protein [Spirochaetales bacterium]